MIRPPKLTAAAVREARELYREGGSLAWISRRFDVHHTTMRAAVLGWTWKQVGGAVDPRQRARKSESSLRRIVSEIARESQL